MSIADTIVSTLKASSAVTNVVSTRIFQDYAYAKAPMPYIVVNRISSERFPHMAGSSGVVRSRMQIDCTANTRASRDALGEAVRGTLDSVTGSIGTAPNDQSVQNSSMEDDRHDTVPPKQGSQRGTFTRSMDFMVTHNETIPTP